MEPEKVKKFILYGRGVVNGNEEWLNLVSYRGREFYKEIKVKTDLLELAKDEEVKIDSKVSCIISSDIEKMKISDIPESFTIKIKDSNFPDGIEIFNSNVDLQLENCTFSLLEIRGTCNNVYLEKCTGSIQTINSGPDFTISNGNYEKIQISRYSGPESSLIFNGVECKTTINVVLSSVNWFSIHETKADFKVFGGGAVVTLSLSGQADYTYSFQTMYMRNFLLNDSKGIIEFFDVSCNNMIGEKEGPSRLEIKNSDLSQVKFNNCDFSRFEIKTIENSDLTGTRFINTKLPDEIHQTDLNNEKETYRQLKLAMANSQDRVNELYFYRKEMEVYHKLIKDDKNIKRREKFNIWVSKFTNDFGNDYVRPIKIYFWLSMGLYILIMVFSFYEEIGTYIIFAIDKSIHVYIDWDKVSYYSIGYFKFLLPTHDVDFIEGLNPFSVLVDFVSRIIFGFLIYQTITAFRRLYKK